MRTKYFNFFFLISLILFFSNNSYSDNSISNKSSENNDLFEMDVKDFFSLYQDVYSIARKEQKLKNASSAIFVLTDEDIKRSGATILPDVLRLVPGVQVAKISSNNWAITIRGANQLYNQKILVLVDNVPIVTPLFNGIFWEALNMPLEIIERIEVIRGPGAAVWGARAVNGVINILTKSSKSQNSEASLAIGNYHQLSTHAISNKRFGDDSGLNLYVKYDQFDNFKDLDSNDINDSWDVFSFGGRADLKLDNSNSIKISNNTFYKDESTDRSFPVLGEPFQDRINGDRFHFGSLLSLQWSNNIDKDSDISLQLNNYFENLHDNILMDYSIYQSELDARYRFKPFEKHEVVTGASFISYRDDIKGSEFVDFSPNSRSLEFYRAFIHDEIELVDETIYLTLGSRFEYNTQIGMSIMPTARTTYAVNKGLSLWGAVSYTEGTASRVNDDISLPVASFREPQTGLPALAQVTGNRNGLSENLLAYEVGIRSEPYDNLYFDLTGFYFNNRKVITREPGEPQVRFNNSMLPSHIVVPFIYDNIPIVDIYGTEFTLNWAINDMFKIAGSYSYITTSIAKRDSLDSVAFDFNDNNPQHMFSIRVHADPTDEIECDAILRYVDSLDKTNIPSYAQLDLRLSWKINSNTRLSLIGRDLLDNSQQEFQAWTFNQPLARIPRSVFSQLTYSF